MSALRDGESRSDVGGDFTVGGGTMYQMDASGTSKSGITIEKQGGASVTNVTTFSELTRGPTYRVRPERHWLPLRRLWFLVSCIPHYLITGSVEVP